MAPINMAQLLPCAGTYAAEVVVLRGLDSFKYWSNERSDSRVVRSICPGACAMGKGGGMPSSGCSVSMACGSCTGGLAVDGVCGAAGRGRTGVSATDGGRWAPGGAELLALPTTFGVWRMGSLSPPRGRSREVGGAGFRLKVSKVLANPGSSGYATLISMTPAWKSLAHSPPLGWSDGSRGFLERVVRDPALSSTDALLRTLDSAGSPGGACDTGASAAGLDCDSGRSGSELAEGSSPLMVVASCESAAGWSILIETRASRRCPRLPS